MIAPVTPTAPYEYVTTTGVIVPDTSGILTEVEGEWTGQFGAGLNTDDTTPQGVMIVGEALARSEVVQNNAAVANQINPNQAMGIFLDAVCALSGLEREENTYTTVAGVLLSGQPSTPIPSGSQASTEVGDIFATSNDVTLSGSGTALATFTAVSPGPVPCGTGGAGLVNVVTDVLGWETVSNATTATLGTLEQGDGPLRQLRAKTLSLQGVALIDATVSAINAIPGVIGSQYLENYESYAQTIDGVNLAKNSIWVCVDGGTPAEIATVLLQNKSNGSGWNGAQTLSVIEPASGQAYLTAWDIPTPVPLLISVAVRQGSYVGDPTADVIAAVLAFGSNTVQPADPNAQPVQGFSVGEDASPFQCASAIAQQLPGLYVQNVQFSLISPVDFSPAEIAIAIYQKATISEGDITVSVIS